MDGTKRGPYCFGFCIVQFVLKLYRLLMYIYVLLFIRFMQGKAGFIWTYQPIWMYKKNYGISPV